jgi:hypothetical protein
MKPQKRHHRTLQDIAGCRQPEMHLKETASFRSAAAWAWPEEKAIRAGTVNRQKQTIQGPANTRGGLCRTTGLRSSQRAHCAGKRACPSDLALGFSLDALPVTMCAPGVLALAVGTAGTNAGEVEPGRDESAAAACRPAAFLCLVTCWERDMCRRSASISLEACRRSARPGFAPRGADWDGRRGWSGREGCYNFMKRSGTHRGVWARLTGNRPRARSGDVHWLGSLHARETSTDGVEAKPRRRCMHAWSHAGAMRS